MFSYWSKRSLSKAQTSNVFVSKFRITLGSTAHEADVLNTLVDKLGNITEAIVAKVTLV